MQGTADDARPPRPLLGIQGAADDARASYVPQVQTLPNQVGYGISA